MVTEEQIKRTYPTIAAVATCGYFVPLVSIGSNLKDVEAGTGTFVVCGGQKGILTNDHVAAIFKDKKLGYVRAASGGNDSTLQVLRFSLIISLPRDDKQAFDVDMAFMLLDEASVSIVCNMGRDFWDLDVAAKKYYQSGFGGLISALWLIHGNVLQGYRIKDDPVVKGRKMYELPYAGPYVVVPDLDNMKHGIWVCGELNMSVAVDCITCPIDSKDKKPHSYCGMSGGALWRVGFDQKGEVANIDLFGIATIQVKPYEEVELLSCRGPMALYRGFYPFVLGALCRTPSVSTATIAYNFLLFACLSAPTNHSQVR